MPKERKEGGGMPHLVIKTISYIYKNGLETEGIFRISGNKTEVLRIKKMFDKGKKVNLNEENVTPHICADVLKSFFREMPEPVFTLEAYHYFNSICDQSESLIITKIRAFFPLLPENNRMILIYLMTLLSKIAENSSVNKMTASNLAIVFTPNLIRTTDNTTITTSALNIIIETLITNCDQILAEEEPEQKRNNPIKRVKSADYSYISSISKPVDPKREFPEFVNSDSTDNLFVEENENSTKVSFNPPPNFLGELKRMQSKKIEGVRSAENLSRTFGSTGNVKQRAIYQPTTHLPPKVSIKLDQSNEDINDEITNGLSGGIPVKSDTVLRRGEFKRGPTFVPTTVPIPVPRTFTTVEHYEKKIELDGSHMKPVPPPRSALSPRSASLSTSPPSDNVLNGKIVPPPVPPRKDKHRRSTSSPSFSFIDPNEQRKIINNNNNNSPRTKPVPPPRATLISPPTSPRSDPIPIANNNNHHNNNHNIVGIHHNNANRPISPPKPPPTPLSPRSIANHANHPSSPPPKPPPTPLSPRSIANHANHPSSPPPKPPPPTPLSPRQSPRSIAIQANRPSSPPPKPPPPTPLSPRQLSHHTIPLPSSPPSGSGISLSNGAKPRKPPIPPRANPPSF